MKTFLQKFFFFIMHEAAYLIFKVRHLFLNGNHKISADKNLVIVSLISGEERYLEEFIQFHILQGVDYFVFYDNSKNNKQLNVLKPFIQNGLVTLFSCPDFGFFFSWLLRKFHSKSRSRPTIQELAFSNFLNDHKNSKWWIAQIDIDEFIYCEDQTVINFIKSKDDLGIKNIEIEQFEFGSSGLIDYPKSVIDSYKIRAKIRKSKKSIGKACYISSMYNPHIFSYRRTFIDKIIKGVRTRIDFPKGTSLIMPNEISKKTSIFINHYKFKCLKDIINRRFNPDTLDSTFLNPKIIPDLFLANRDEECDKILKARDYLIYEKKIKK